MALPVRRRSVEPTDPRPDRSAEGGSPAIVPAPPASVRPIADGAFQIGLRVSLAVLLVVGAALFLYIAWSIIQPLIVSVVLATTLWPWVSKIAAVRIGPRRWRMPRVAAAALVYLTTFLFAGAIIWFTLAEAVPQVGRMFETYPRETAFLREYFEPFQRGDVAAGARRVAEDVVAAETSRQNQRSQGNEAAANGNRSGIDAGALAIGLFGGLVTLGLVLIFTFFLLLDGGRFAQWMLMLLPRERRLWARSIGLRIRDRVSHWVMAQVLYALISGAIAGTAMWALQLPSPLLYAVGGGILAVMPGVGPALVAIPAFLVALGLSPWQAGGVLAFGLALWIVDGTYIAPRVYGTILRLPMFSVLLGMLLGAAVMGIWGALIAPAVTAALQILLRDQMGRPPEQEAR